MTLCYEIMCNRNKLQCPSAFTVCHIGLHPAIYPSVVQGRFLLISYHWPSVRSK